MTNNQYHILNGDSLKLQFPNELDGEIIVARECMIDGSVQGDGLKQVMNSRLAFMRDAFQVSEMDYKNKSAAEFLKITNLMESDHVFLWFEHDLFCQTNMWFVVHLIDRYTNIKKVYLTTPPLESRYSFGSLSGQELVQAYGERMEINHSEIKEISSLWQGFQQDDFTKMYDSGEKLNKRFPFINESIKVHEQRFPDADGLGRPERSLIRIVNEINSIKFGDVFQRFNKEEDIYGFGDVQLKRIFERLIRNGNI